MDSTAVQTDQARMTHYLFTFAGTGEVVPKQILAQKMGDALHEAGVNLKWAVSYTSPSMIDPAEVNLPEVWDSLSATAKLSLRHQYPALALAIDLVVGSTKEN